MLVDAGGKTSFFVRKIMASALWSIIFMPFPVNDHPKRFVSWEPGDALRVDVSELVSADMQQHQMQAFC